MVLMIWPGMSGNGWQIGMIVAIMPVLHLKCTQGLISGTSRVLRGGSWYSDDSVLRSAVRYWDRSSGSPTTTIGFRCAVMHVIPIN